MKILGQKIELGESKTIQFNTAKLYTTTKVEVPIIIERSLHPGPTILITAGIHGDEINGVEIVRQLISKKINKPARGTIICIPILNVFGFLSMNRQFPDGHDLNRVFPGTKTGSLASRVAFHFTKEILPHADYCLDFHTGGASRFNAAQIRVTPNDYVALKYAKIFNAPFTVHSKILDKSYRQTCVKMGIPSLLFEGGKSMSSDRDIIEYGVEGVLRFLNHLEMLSPKFTPSLKSNETIVIEKSTWIRANKSGLLHVKISCNKLVKKGEVLATITDPYGTMRFQVKAPNEGHIINVNQSPIVHQGDAIFHISTLLADV
ncbi:MAG: succinylglutamate desuccinylase [Flavobacteriaceae bacterium CG_4_8_14_3_um_filter_34_10]|nr:succinylglutamate desuccinylase/aspartoacylase family protein [Flavobacteriia bacterium]OIP51004.1 MAG: succinylglutamate desuccinylase [Flavobacteriaceae bacterium CG2_30_34_30]PIQ18712.1 MAG: succinylglutamate desuccinylase [Flavobacteriaceae bacterium CG18_big_fil_WC_8_21_14_2_50_34_36]PIV48739.1 MAG: succinylglutamate desuccinylase [Flavobacteriaceae bacterium CG02_land_8_20_14_3_00_34_13]PIX08939.1 MAG: succinylglutamate desuccinylase [Flavobacteriaceae bacterium CG_4_8_14_3_um_filter_3